MVVVSQASWEEGLDPPLESPEVLRMHIGERGGGSWLNRTLRTGFR